MTSFNPTSFGKIVNPDFAMAALHGYEPHGEFKAYVRMAKPGQRPANMKVMEIHSDDMLVSIRCILLSSPIRTIPSALESHQVHQCRAKLLCSRSRAIPPIGNWKYQLDISSPCPEDIYFIYLQIVKMINYFLW